MTALLRDLSSSARSLTRQGLVLGVVLGLAIGSLALAAVERARA